MLILKNKICYCDVSKEIRSLRMKIRWLGAFGKERRQNSLHDSFSFELSGAGGQVNACEPIAKGSTGKIRHAVIGLLVKNSAVIRTFRSDVWSVKLDNGTLKATRRGCKDWNTGDDYGHREAWCAVDYCGIVLKRPLNTFPKKVQKTVLYWAEKKALPVFFLNKGGLKKLNV